MVEIVYVDDAPEELKGAASREQWARIHSILYDGEDPGDEALEAAQQAKLWLFDYFLVEEGVEKARAENGLSLFHKWRSELGERRPTTAVVSGDLRAALGSSLGARARYHVHARRLGVEWIGEKSEDSVRQVTELATASGALADLLTVKNKAAEGDNAADFSSMTVDLDRLSFDLLKAPRGVDWSRSVERQVDRARPPRISQPLEGVGAARLVISWLLHNVLPYPSFLLSDVHAALRLGISPEGFRRIAAEDTALSQTLAAALYRGPLAGLSGRRWWRAGIDGVAWRLSQDDAGYRVAFERLVAGLRPDWLDLREPVVLSDEDLVETESIVEASSCVRVTDENFPADVDPAWVSIEAARENRALAAKIVFEDRDLLEGLI